jgi:hypothetical protein
MSVPGANNCDERSVEMSETTNESPPRSVHGPVIALKAKLDGSAAHRDAVKSAASVIEECTDRFFDEAVSPAMTGPWREWSEAQPVGAIMNIDEERLASANDPIVLELLALVRRSQEALEQLATSAK